jgi:hypothetical protein
MATTKKKDTSGRGGKVLTDEQKIALIKTGNPNGKVNIKPKGNKKK